MLPPPSLIDPALAPEKEAVGTGDGVVGVEDEKEEEDEEDGTLDTIAFPEDDKDDDEEDPIGTEPGPDPGPPLPTMGVPLMFPPSSRPELLWGIDRPFPEAEAAATAAVAAMAEEVEAEVAANTPGGLEAGRRCCRSVSASATV